MKKILPLFLLIASCSKPLSLEENIIGVWKCEDSEVMASFKFQEQNQCGFIAGSKNVNDAIGFPCTYNINGNTIEIFTEPSNQNNTRILLIYNKSNNTILFDGKGKDIPIQVFKKDYN